MQSDEIDTSVILENWRSVPRYEHLYEVSNLGHVGRIMPARGTRVGRLLKWHLNSIGYPRVHLTMNRKLAKHLVHRLVAEAFIGPCPDRYNVNHKDRNRQNPSLDNLEYVTVSENVKHAAANGAIWPSGEQPARAKLTECQVIQIRQLAMDGTLSQRAIAAQYGVHNTTVFAIVKGRKWKRLLSNTGVHD